jgi:glutamate N-acetyltransferase/amino-acid N-acetyltransferase
MNMTFTNDGITGPLGFVANGIYCGLRRNKTKMDLAMVYSETPCTAAGMYTKNKVKGAPLLVTEEHLQNGYARAIICNSGNANTCNADGVEKARQMASHTADVLSISPEEVIVASTGVIGQPLNIDAIISGIPPLAKSLNINGGDNAASAIMTTDTVAKSQCVEFVLGGKQVKIGAMAKGSGMIHPNMATMLCFITSDVAISSLMLKKALSYVVERTFNCVSVDGDTSTNDMVCIMANAQAGNPEITTEGPDYEIFAQALFDLCSKMARMIAKDGEGATKLLECRIHNCQSEDQGRDLAKSVIMSSLVKSAFFGADANWGRILCALGYCDVPLDVTKIDVTLSSRMGEILVCKDGAGVDFSEEKAKEILLEDEIFIDINLKDGLLSATAWGCDLTYDYVRINGDYRT